jgi:hypothetical protein
LRTLTACIALAAWSAVSTASVAHAQKACADATLTVNDALQVGAFGVRMAHDGDILVALDGTTGTSINGGGTLHVFERSASGAWEWTNTIAPPPDIVTADGFGVAFDVWDGWLAISAPADDPLGTNSGSVFVYERVGRGQWNLVSTLVNPPEGSSPTNSAFYGWRIAGEGDVFAVALPFSSVPVFNGQGVQTGQVTSGAVLVYRRTLLGTWEVETKLRSLPLLEDTVFGLSLALDEGRLYVGTSGEKVGAITTSSVTVHEHVNGAWTPTAKFLEPSLAASTDFGEAIAVDGDVLAIGSPNVERCHTYVRQTDGTWSEPELVPAPFPFVSNDWGSSLAVRGDTLVVGTTNQGTTCQLYERAASGAWYRSLDLSWCGPESAPQFGVSVIATDDEFLIGAWGTTFGQPDLGSIAVFRRGSLYHSVLEDSTVLPIGQKLFLRAGPRWAGAPYVVLGSLSGTAPGLELGPGLVLPLNFDAYTSMTLALSAPIDDAFDVLKLNGERTAAFETPTGLPPSMSGLVLHHAFVAIDPLTFELHVSNSVPLRLVP